MKRLVQALFLVFCAIAAGAGVYYLIRERSSSAAASRPVATRQVEATAGDASVEEREARAEREATVNRITALPNEVILDVSSLNLDEDEGDEQALLVRKTDRADGKLSVVVADYVPSRRAWVRAWEGETLATKPTTFSLQASDLIGDHGLELVCRGMDESNAQTLSAFRRTGQETLLAYAPICAVAADAITIEEADRPEGYQLGQTSGESWTISAYSRDKDSPNILDQVKSSYRWDPKRGAYELAATVRIPGAQVEKDMIAKVLTGSAQDFERFLQGIWYHEGTAPFDPAARLLVFDRDAKTITFYSAEAQGVYSWTESNPTRYGIYASCQNESVANLRRLMNIELTGSESITMRVFEDIQMKVEAEDRWDGAYRKFPADGSSPASRSAAGYKVPDFKLDGPFRSPDGGEITFAAPRYSLRSGASAERGSYNVYMLGKDCVLELSVVDESGIRSSRRTYRATYSESKSGRTLVRRLVLAPARTTIAGLELLEQQNLVFEQRVGG